VAGRRSGETQLRNDQIFAEWSQKPDLPAIAAKYGLSPQRVGQIIAQYNPDLETEHERALLKGGLWNLIHQIQDVIDQPGYKLAPNGRYATDDEGFAVPDTTAKIEAMKVKGGVYKQIAQLVGAEKVVPKQLSVEFTVAEQQKNAAIAAERAKLEALARQAGVKPPGVVPGEVLPAIEPPGQPAA